VPVYAAFTQTPRGTLMFIKTARSQPSIPQPRSTESPGSWRNRIQINHRGNDATNPSAERSCSHHGPRTNQWTCLQQRRREHQVQRASQPGFCRVGIGALTERRITHCRSSCLWPTSLRLSEQANASSLTSRRKSPGISIVAYELTGENTTESFSIFAINC
jgi:hypothetical protein